LATGKKVPRGRRSGCVKSGSGKERIKKTHSIPSSNGKGRQSRKLKIERGEGGRGGISSTSQAKNSKRGSPEGGEEWEVRVAP